jgi:uncharacterized repeat protein (TIGR01451 family)
VGQPTPQQCPIPLNPINNRAGVSYNTPDPRGSSLLLQGISNQLKANDVDRALALPITALGVRDSQGNIVTGAAFGSLVDELMRLGLSEEEANAGAIALAKTLTQLPENTSLNLLQEELREALVKAAPAKTDLILSIFNSSSAGAIALQLVTELFRSILIPAELTASEAQQATKAALSILLASGTSTLDRQTLEPAFQSAAAVVPSKSGRIRQALDNFLSDSQNLSAEVKAGDLLYFDFLLSNIGRTAMTLELVNENSSLNSIVVPVQQQVKVRVAVKLEAIAETGATVGARLNRNEQKLEIELKGSGSLTGVTAENPVAIAECPAPTPSTAEQIVAIVAPPPQLTPLVDPLGQVTGCAGETLTNYEGFNVGLYEPDPNDPTGGVTEAIALTPTGPGTNFEGLKPNLANSNPFFLSNGEQGKYNFLLDISRGQLDPGDTYILVINPPTDSLYSERRIRISIDSRTSNLVTYTATSLDGRAISATKDATSLQQTLRIEDANRVGLILAVLNLNTSVCQAQELQITKTADRAAAEPGDTVIYRLLIRNLSSSSVNNVAVTDALPLGFQLRAGSVRAELQDGNRVAIATSQSGSTVVFNAAGVAIPSRQALVIAYAVTLTPDSLRGSGENSASVEGQRTEPPLNIVRDGPALFRLRIRPGLLSDSGTIIGRVFEDKNFDGEQQPGEPGIPNAVIFLDDGTRIVTDPNGMFSVTNVLPGYRTGVLDLSSLPGYTLAPNLYFNERNSQSRLVQLAPGGLVRMNFAVTPAFREEEGK